MISNLHGLRHVTDEAFQRAAASQHPNEYVARINFGETARRQLEHVVRRAVRQRADPADLF